ncbi:hypothetical protein JCM10450v2_007025 [Rhodotorula kratochvilovae]
MDDAPPSVFLPGLVPLPPPTAILTCISRLGSFCAPPSALVDLRPSVYTYSASQADADNEADAFELGFARSWLEKVLAAGSRALARGEDETGEWEEAVDEAARMLAEMSGPSAQGSTTKTYLLPSPAPSSSAASASLAYPTPPPTRPSSTAPPFTRTFPSPVTATPYLPPTDPLALTIRDGTLVEASTGHRTWGAASILAHLLASSPSRFFPPFPPSRPLRVLELGSGTGLVGLCAVAVLAHAGAQGAEVILSDGGAEPDAVLANLRDNVAANASAAKGIRVAVERLDWGDYLPGAAAQRRDGGEDARFDVLFGADLAYERGQAALLHAAVAGLLRLPSPDASVGAGAAQPAFWLALPLRPTHGIEMAEVAAHFPPPAAPPAMRLARRDGVSGRAYRLVEREREEILGPSGFGGRAVRGRVSAEGEMRYVVMKVGWEEVHGV